MPFSEWFERETEGTINKHVLFRGALFETHPYVSCIFRVPSFVVLSSCLAGWLAGWLVA